MEDAPEVVDNVSTSMGTVTWSGSIRDKMVWRKSRAMLSARWELFLMLPPEREVAFEEALELLREEDIIRWAGKERKCRRNRQLTVQRTQKNVTMSQRPSKVINRLKKSSVKDCFVLISGLCVCSHTRAGRMMTDEHFSLSTTFHHSPSFTGWSTHSAPGCTWVSSIRGGRPGGNRFHVPQGPAHA